MSHIMGQLNVNFFMRDKQDLDYSFLVNQEGIGKTIIPQIKKLNATYDLEDEALASDALNRLVNAIEELEKPDGGSYEDAKKLLHQHTVKVIELVENLLGNPELGHPLFINILKKCMLGVYQAALYNIRNAKYAHLALKTSKVDHASLEKLARYETKLDRKFERTLGMLLKLQQIRFQREAVDV